MDEYLFITLAKLKADRLQLERKQRHAGADPEGLRLQPAETAGASRGTTPHPVRTSVLARWFSQQPRWRAQS
jgi:hypothetical protein